jgi:hypothetical protein
MTDENLVLLLLCGAIATLFVPSVLFIGKAFLLLLDADE